ncbi:MAG: AAA family ATPase [Candidatus Hodarchaeota archaeon]
MPKKSTNTPMIGVTGGKGGTGKTMVATNLAASFMLDNKRVLIVDCDVDAPNVAILLGAELEKKEEVKIFQPIFDYEKCTRCGKCTEVCREHAILQVEDRPPILFYELCTGCEACMLVCHDDAISAGEKVIGWVCEGTTHGIDLVVGELKLHETRGATVVKAARRKAFEKNITNKYDTIIIDTAPGAHCDVVNALYGMDITFAVTESTPFGAHDLDLVLDLFRMMELRVFVVLNRADIKGKQGFIEEVCKKHSIEIISEIPLDRSILDCYVRGIPVVSVAPSSPGAEALHALYEKAKEILHL